MIFSTAHSRLIGLQVERRDEGVSVSLWKHLVPSVLFLYHPLRYSTFSTETAGTANEEQENRLTTGEDQHYEDVLAQASTSTLLKQLTHDRSVFTDRFVFFAVHALQSGAFLTGKVCCNFKTYSFTRIDGKSKVHDLGLL